MTETNYAVPPGAYLEEWMEEKGMSLAEASEGLMYGPEHVRRIVQGKVRVGETTARRLTALTGIPVSTWLLHEAGYQRDLERLRIDRVKNALLRREAEASARLDGGTFSLGPQDIVTFSKASLKEALRGVIAWADYDLLKSLENPEDGDAMTLDELVERFPKNLEG